MKTLPLLLVFVFAGVNALPIPNVPTSPGQDSELREKARVVFLRPHKDLWQFGLYGSGRSVKVLCDGQVVAHLSFKRYFTLLLAPGKHTFSASTDNISEEDVRRAEYLKVPGAPLREVTVEAGKTYYIGYALRYHDCTDVEVDRLVDLIRSEVSSPALPGSAYRIKIHPRLVWYGYRLMEEGLALSELKNRKPIDVKNAKSPSVSLEPIAVRK